MFKRYELHNHTDQSDAHITCRQLTDHMAADGVDCFAITDHNTTSGQKIIRELLEETGAPIQCAYGMEYTTYYGHIICPVLTKYVPWDSIDRNKPELLFRACKAAGAITGVAHPFSYGDPFARGCRFDMTISDFTAVDYIEIINNSEKTPGVNEAGVRWWEELTLRGEKLAACAGMDMHNLDDMSMKYATYAEGAEGRDAVEELRTAIENRRTWVSCGLLVVWAIEGDGIRFEIADAKKPGFIPSDAYVLTLTNRDGVREYDMTSGCLTLSLSQMGEIEIPKLYGGDPTFENLICVAPPVCR